MHETFSHAGPEPSRTRTDLEHKYLVSSKTVAKELEAQKSAANNKEEDKEKIRLHFISPMKKTPSNPSHGVSNASA